MIVMREIREIRKIMDFIFLSFYPGQVANLVKDLMSLSCWSFYANVQKAKELD